MVKSLDQIPGILSRSGWAISINGHVVKDWVVANYTWVTEGYI